ncbi:MAG: translocation/assembly module TamB domain-containing protein [Treponema sp.]|nr:translocation/assembly module TamB domain-containing protein [Treponema sp.]
MILLSLTALIVKPVETCTKGMMDLLRDSLIGEAEKILGRTIRYASASPSIVGSLDIRDVSVYDPLGEPLLNLERFHAAYSVLDLLAGRKTGALRLVRMDGPAFTYDFDKDRDLPELFTRQGEKPPSLVLPEKCLLELRRGSILVKRGDRSLAITGLYFDGRIQDQRIVFDGNWHTEAVLAGLAGSLNAVQVDGGLYGDFARDFSDGDLALSVLALRGDTFELGNLIFDFSIRDNVAVLTNSGDSSLGVLLAYNLDTGALSGELRPDNFVPGEILRFFGDWKRYDPWLALTLRGDASFSTEGAEGPNYRFDLRGNGPGLPLFEFAGSGGGEKVIFDRLRLAAADGALEYSGDLRFNPPAPEGILTFENFSFAKNQAAAVPGLTGELRFIRQGNDVDIFAENFSSGGITLSAVSGGLDWEESGCTYGLELFRFKNIESYEDVQSSSIVISGSYDRGESPGPEAQLQGSVALDAFSVADILAMAKPFYSAERIPEVVEELAGNITVTTEIFLSTDFEHISYNAPLFVAAFESPADTFVVGSVSGTDRSLEVSGGRVNWKNGSADIAFQTDFSDSGDISFSVQTGYRDFAYYFEGTFFDHRTLTIRGSYGISVYVTASEFGGYSGYVDLNAVPIPFRGRTGRLSVDAALRFDSLSSWVLDINRLALSENENPAIQFTNIAVSGTADQDGARIEQIVYEDRLGELSGSVQADWERDFSAVTGHLILLGADESCILDAAYRNSGGASLGNGKTGRAAFEVRLSGVQLDRFLQSGRNARLSGTVDGIWNRPDSYELNINLESLEIPGGAVPVFASARGFINQDMISFNAVDAQIGDVEAHSSVFILDRSRSILDISAGIEGEIEDWKGGLDMTLRASLSPSDSWFGIAQAANSFHGLLDIKSAYLDEMRLAEPCSFEFSRIREDDSGPVVRVSGGPGDMLRFELLDDGSLYLDIANPSPLQATITGTCKDFTLDVYASDIYVDMPVVWALLPTKDILSFTGGFVTAQTAISGSLFDPEFSGSGWGSGVRLEVPDYLAAEIGSVSGAVTLEGNEISFGPLEAACGDGKGTISLSLLFNRWVPSCYIDILVQQQDAIPFSFNVAGIDASGDVSGNLRFSMENRETLTITGNALAENTVMTLDAEELSAIRDGLGVMTTDLDVVIDARLTVGKRVEFLWPNESLPVLRAYGSPGTGVRVIADTRIPQFALDGDISLQGGEIYYFQRSFFIREGRVFFSANDSQMDPRISARAEIRERNDEGPVIISMIIDNAPLSSFTPRFESNPTLSQLDIYSLLGQIPAEGQSSEVVFRTLTEFLTQFTVIRGVERRIRNILGLDMFTVRIQVLQNALLQVMNNDPEEQKRNAIGNYLDNTAVYMGKYIGSDLFIQAQIALRYDQYQAENGGLRFEPDIGLDLRTPLVDIQWNMTPRHPEDLFITDQTFSFVWRWSF